MTKSIPRTAACLLASAAFILSSPLLAEPAKEKEGKPLDTYSLLSLLGEAFERTRASYVEEVSDQDLLEAAISGMLSSLDPHSAYLPPKVFKDMQVQTKGEFGGLGIEVTMENGLVKVISPYDDTPAQKAGLKPGDFITHLDGEQVLGMTLNDAVDRMRGKPDTTIKLHIRRGAKINFDVTLKRAVIKIQTVRSRTEGDIGYVRITSFSEQTDATLNKAIADLRKKLGVKMKGLIVDLRNNPGGLLDQAVGVSDSFLEQGEIVSTRTRKPGEAQRFNAKKGDVAEGLPIIILINEGSASASEIVAGALQDHKRAVLLGGKSFGKGSVQTIVPMGHGAIKLTTARYYTPAGRSIQQVGIEPDIYFPPLKPEQIAANKAPRGEASLRHSLKNEQVNGQQNGNPGDGQPEAKPEEKSTPALPSSEEMADGKPQDDIQLKQALELMNKLSYKQGKTVQ
jgi:carboxyl-terminal processing protease